MPRQTLLTSNPDDDFESQSEFQAGSAPSSGINFSEEDIPYRLNIPADGVQDDDGALRPTRINENSAEKRKL